MQASITIDTEHDCLSEPKTYRGIVDGVPKLLRLFRDRGIVATFFVTGDVARRYPKVVESIVDAGHELGCHGDTHARFSTLGPDEARREIDATETLNAFVPQTSFRAPNLDFPNRYLPYLREAGYAIDSSQARYKRGSVFAGPSMAEGLRRIPVSTMPSVVRLPRAVRRGVLMRLREPAVLYFHPWEFVDMTQADIPYDCRFRTGQPALDTLEDAIGFLQARGATFRPDPGVGLLRGEWLAPKARLAANIVVMGAANLFQHKLRALAALSGIAVALFLLVLQYESLHATRARVSALYSFFNFDIALVPDSYQILISPGTIDRVRLSQARTVPHVERTYGIGVAISTWAQRHQTNGNAVLLIGLDDDPAFIRDPRVSAGMRRLGDARSILFDALAQPDLHPFSVGHVGMLGGEEVEIRSLFDLGLFFYAAGAAIVPNSLFSRLSGHDPRQVTVGLVQTTPGTDVEKVKADLQAALPDDVQVLTRQELIEQEQAYFVETKPIGIMMDIGMLIACLVAVTIMIQVLATEIGNRLNEYAVLKAMGFGPIFVYGIALTQSAILGIAALLPALAISAFALAVINRSTQLGAGLSLGLAALALLVALGTGLIAAFAVMWRIERADPAELY